MQYQIIFLGNAGSGKTSLAYSFNHWLKETIGASIGSIVCNLDPASETFPYKPDFDIRKYFDAKEIMIKEGLGPNGAILRSIELMEKNLQVWIKEILKLKSDFRVYDTPGQLETLLYHESGPRLLSMLCQKNRTVGVFLVEAKLANDPVSLVTLLMQATITKVRLDLPIVLAISKADITVREDLDRLISDNNYLLEAVNKEGKGGQKDTALLLCRAFSQIPWIQRTVKVSSFTKTGFNDLYEISNEVSCACGDLS